MYSSSVIKHYDLHGVSSAISSFLSRWSRSGVPVTWPFVYTNRWNPPISQNKKNSTRSFHGAQMWAILDIAHQTIADLLIYFDTARTKFSSNALLDKRCAISHREPTSHWKANTLTIWLKLVPRASREQPPASFAWTSYLLRQGAATKTNGTTIHNTKFFGGRGLGTRIIDFIEPTVLPSPGRWQLFG
jgi:hypothetical protein